MRKPQGYDDAQAYTGDYKTLPAGGYICEIKKVDDVLSRSGQPMWAIFLDIASGEYKGYWEEMYRSKKNTNGQAKWPCIYNQLTEGKSTSFLKGIITCLETSNNGYKHDWNNNIDILKGKRIGVIFGREQYGKSDGKAGWATKPQSFRSVKTIETGDFEIPEDKLLYNNSLTTDAFMANKDDLPF